MNQVSVNCGFYNLDKFYDSDSLNKIFEGIINDGIFKDFGSCMNVSPSSENNRVEVGTGRAWLNHTWTKIDAPVIIKCNDAHLLFDRIDAVVLEINKTDIIRDNIIKIIEGKPSTNPVKPELTKVIK